MSIQWAPHYCQRADLKEVWLWVSGLQCVLYYFYSFKTFQLPLRSLTPQAVDWFVVFSILACANWSIFSLNLCFLGGGSMVISVASRAISSIWVRTKSYLRRWSEVKRPEVTWPEVTLVTPQVTWPQVTWPEEALSGSGPDRKFVRKCAHA